MLLAGGVANRSDQPKEPRVAEEPGASQLSAVLVGETIRVTDGDTIRVQLDSGPIKVRVFGADAPERDTQFGPPATKLMRSLVEDKAVELESVTQDSYDRIVARVFVGETDVGAAMIEKGYAWAYRRYLGQVEGADRYCDLEAKARTARLGLWADPPVTWVPPWNLRASGRGERVPDHDWSRETAETCRAAIRRGAEPPRSVAPQLGPAPKRTDCLIKGNISSKRERVYHVPGSSSYEKTKIDERRGERWFCTEEEARAAGWRAPR